MKEVIFFTPVLSKEYFIQHEKFMEGFISSILKYTNEFYFFYYVNEISDFQEFLETKVILMLMEWKSGLTLIGNHIKSLKINNI